MPTRATRSGMRPQLKPPKLTTLVSENTGAPGHCPLCSRPHRSILVCHKTTCPKLQAMRFYPDGRVKTNGTARKARVFVRQTEADE